VGSAAAEVGHGFSTIADYLPLLLGLGIVGYIVVDDDNPAKRRRMI